MESKPSIGKKALAILGLMMIGANSSIVKNYQEPNCNLYDHSDGSCIRCSFRYWKTSEARCVQVSDNCKAWKESNGDCTDCYKGWTLSDG